MSAFAVRAVVEGFYGAPYTPPEREALLRFLGEHGFERYVYGPKADRAHRALWRAPYDEEPLAHLERAVRVAAENGLRFCYALSPGLDIRYGSDDDLEHVLAKFAAMRSIGVRDFALFLDDIAPAFRHADDAARFASFAAAQAALCNRVRLALVRADEGATLAMCPTQYHGAPPFGPYLHELGSALAPEIDVYYTGVDVCSRTIGRDEVEAFARALVRPPIIWDNYPVNDGAMRSEMHLGPIRGRVSDLAGLVKGFAINPMNQAEASKVALHTFAAYFRDPRGYDPDDAWDAALAAVAGEHAPALRAFAETSLGSVLGTPDAVRLAGATDAAVRELEGDAPAGEAVAALERQLHELDDACHTLVQRGRHYALRAELLPWIEALDAWVWAGVRACEAAQALASGGDPGPALGRLREPLARALAHHARSGGRVLLPFVDLVRSRADMAADA